MPSLITKTILGMGHFLPKVKAKMPTVMRRWMYLHIFQRDEVERIRSKGCRIWFENTALPALIRQGKRVLFIGVAPYTWGLLERLRRLGAEVTTLDIDPAAALWGAPRHVITSVMDPPPELMKGEFDVVCCNGLIGFGINTESDLVAFSKAMMAMAKEGALIQIGWLYARTELDPAKFFEESNFTLDAPLPIPRYIRFPDDQESFLTFSNHKRLHFSGSPQSTQ